MLYTGSRNPGQLTPSFRSTSTARAFSIQVLRRFVAFSIIAAMEAHPARPQPSPRFIDDVEQTVPPQDRRGRRTPDNVLVEPRDRFVLQQRGSNILTDPVWSERVSPLSWAGPRRHRNPGVRWGGSSAYRYLCSSATTITIISISSRVTEIGRPPAICSLIVPLGVGKLLRSEGIGPYAELDWGQSLKVDQTSIHCVPAVHFSARGLFDRNKTLWCGYVIQDAAGSVYFAGDTAFGEHFARIRERHGPPTLALLPIGAYDPRWFMSPVHMAPEDAVKAHPDPRCKDQHCHSPRHFPAYRRKRRCARAAPQRMRRRRIVRDSEEWTVNCFT